MDALPAPSSSTVLQRGAWLVVALLFPVALLNYLDRQVLASMKNSVMHDISDIGTEAHWGMLGAVFKWVYAGLSPIGGYIADRTNKKRVILLSLGVWSAVTWATGHMHSFQGMMITRGLMGISEGFYIPAALSLIADFHRGSTRSKAIGIHQMGIYLGIALGGYSGYAADSSDNGWRLVFVICGCVGIGYAILLAWSLPQPPAEEGGAGADSPGKDGVSWWAALAELVKNGSFILLVLYFTLPALAGWVVKDWMPPILMNTFHLAQGQAGVSATLYVTMASFVGAYAGGALADRWMRVSQRGRINASALGMVLCIPALLGVGYAPSLGMAILALVLFGLGWGFYDTNNMPILCQIVSPRLRATGYGLMNLVSISGGAFATWQVGVLRDAGKPAAVIFVLCAGAAAVAVGLVLLIRPREESR